MTKENKNSDLYTFLDGDSDLYEKNKRFLGTILQCICFCAVFIPAATVHSICEDRLEKRRAKGKNLMPWGLIMRKGFNTFALMMLLAAAVGSLNWAASQRDKVSYPDAVKRAYDMRGLAKPGRVYPIMGLLSVMAATGAGVATAKRNTRWAKLARELNNNEVLDSAIFTQGDKFYADAPKIYEIETKCLAIEKDWGDFRYEVFTSRTPDKVTYVQDVILESDACLGVVKKCGYNDVTKLFDAALKTSLNLRRKAQDVVFAKMLSMNPDKINELVAVRQMDEIPKKLLRKYGQYIK